MKRILRHYVINTFSLYIVSIITSGLVFEKGMESILLTGIGLTIVSLLARPIINILLLPVNLITFGLFRWVSSAVTLYLVTLVVPGFKIASFTFLGLSTQWFSLPTVSFGGFASYIGFSFLLSLLTSFIYWLVK